MFTVTELAREKLKDFFNGVPEQPIRIYMRVSPGNDRELAMMLDEASEDDSVHRIDGFTFVVDGHLLESAQPIHIDVTPHGLSLASRLTASDSDCGCGCGGH